MLATHRYGWSFDVDDGVVFAAGYHPDEEPEVGGHLVWSVDVEGGEPVVVADGFGDEYATGVVIARWPW